MRLRPISGLLQFPWMALDCALAQRGVAGQVWIIKTDTVPDRYLVCVEAPEGPTPVPLCQAWFGVFAETDRFTDPVYRVNLGPGVWDVEEER